MDWWGGRDWRDSSKPLEDQILDILNHMEVSARQLERERERPDVEDDEPSPTETMATSTPLNDDFELLLAEAQRWKQLQVLDEYLAALFAARDHTPGFLQWLARARAQRQAAANRLLKGNEND